MDIQDLMKNLKEQTRAARRTRKQMMEWADKLARSSELLVEDFVYQWIGENHGTAFVYVSDFGTITVYESRDADTGMVLDDAALIRFYEWVSDNRAA